MKSLKFCKLAMFYHSSKLEDKTNVCIFDTLGGKKVIYEEKSPLAPLPLTIRYAYGHGGRLTIS